MHFSSLFLGSIKNIFYLCTKKRRKDIKWTRDLHHVQTKRCLQLCEHFRQGSVNGSRNPTNVWKKEDDRGLAPAISIRVWLSILPFLLPSSLSHQPSSFSLLPSSLFPQPSAFFPQPSSISHLPSSIIPQPSAFFHLPSSLSHQPSSIILHIPAHTSLSEARSCPYCS